MSSTRAPPCAPIAGYYAVRKGKGGLRDCIFVLWSRAKDYLDPDTKENEEIEFSFFANFQDAVQYIHPSANGHGEVGRSREAEDAHDSVAKQPPSEASASDADNEQPESRKKRKSLQVKQDLQLEPPKKIIRIESDDSIKGLDLPEGLQDSNDAPLHLLLEQGFHQNFPKGWRSQHLGLHLNRREYPKEPAVKQYLKDLKELQNYRETYSQPPRSEEKHSSGASHPLSVLYLNWAWGVCNSYHRDIRRQQKKAGHTPTNEVAAVELPHFKALTQQGDRKANYNPNPTKKPSPNNTTKPPPPKTNLLVAKHPKSLPDLLEEAYNNFRHRGWRARDILPGLHADSDDDEEAEIHRNYVAQLRRKNYLKELNILAAFRESNPEDVKRYRILQHPSGIESPFSVEYLQYSWEISEEDLVDIMEMEESRSTATSSVATVSPSASTAAATADTGAVPEHPRPTRRTLPTHSSSSKPMAEAVPSSPLVASQRAETIQSSIFSNTDVVDDDTPQLIEALRAHWFQGSEKGWRSEEMGLVADPRSKTLTMAARKKREQFYIDDLNILKDWWKTYPSSQHYLFTVPENEGEDVDDDSYKNMSYAASQAFRITAGCKSEQKRHKSGINAPWSLTYLNWSWGVSNSYNRDLIRKDKRKSQYQRAAEISKEQEGEHNQAALYI